MILSFFLITLIFAGNRDAGAADVPVTVESDSFGAVCGGLFSAFPCSERRTCDPDFWNVLEDRAWTGAQRELTQNNNIFIRPDSVLSVSCFDSYLRHLGRYSDNNFPSRPQQSEGGLSGFWLKWFVVEPARATANGDALFNRVLDNNFAAMNPMPVEGIMLFAALEFLVLDQLMDNVTGIGNALDDVLLGLGQCNKGYYVQDAFPGRLLGDRAKGWPMLGPVWPSLSSSLNQSIGESGANFNGCARMNQLWDRAKCYDFAYESRHYLTPITPLHDGFYTLEQYRDNAATGNDYRREPDMCSIPTTDSLPSISGTQAACDLIAHGMPSPNLLILGLVTPQTGTIWSSGYAGANPAPNTAGGMDQYDHFLSLRDTTNCSNITPIKTGFVVVNPDGTKYVDSVCPAPGCWFNPPSNMSGTGSCN